MAKKPVTPGRQPSRKGKGNQHTAAEKAVDKAKLVSKGVDLSTAAELVGEAESLTREQIATRRIAWQKTLPKST